MYREAFESRPPERDLARDYGALAALVSCLVIWAGFVYVLVKWAGWLA